MNTHKHTHTHTLTLTLTQTHTHTHIFFLSEKVQRISSAKKREKSVFFWPNIMDVFVCAVCRRKQGTTIVMSIAALLWVPTPISRRYHTHTHKHAYKRNAFLALNVKQISRSEVERKFCCFSCVLSWLFKRTFLKKFLSEKWHFQDDVVSQFKDTNSNLN